MLHRIGQRIRWELAPTGSLHPDDHPLLALLHQETLLVTALQQLSWRARAALAQDGPRARALLYAFADVDAAVAVVALRRIILQVPGHGSVPAEFQLQERAWDRGCPHVAYPLVIQGLRTPLQFMQRFAKERDLWARMVNDGMMQPTCFMRQFAADVDELALWLRCGKLSQELCRQWYAGDALVLETLQDMGALGGQALITQRPRSSFFSPEPLPPYSAAVRKL